MPIRVLKDQKKKCTQEIKKTRHEAEAKAVDQGEPAQRRGPGGGGAHAQGDEEGEWPD